MNYYANIIMVFEKYLMTWENTHVIKMLSEKKYTKLYLLFEPLGIKYMSTYVWMNIKVWNKPKQ